MNGNDGFNWEHLDRMIAPEGPASQSWFSRVHRYLIEAFPGRFVFRLHENLTTLEGWLKDEEISREDHFLRELGFDRDRVGSRNEAENGWARFTWNGERYEAVAFMVTEETYQYTYTWVVCAGQEAAETLANELGRHDKRSASKVLVFKDGSWEDSPRLEAELKAYTWDSVVLPPAARQRLQGVSETFFRSGKVYESLGIPWKLGFLFVGPPGTGKTLTTKVLAANCGVRFLSLRTFGRKWGRDATPDTVRAIFEGARKRAPCILCLEEVDALIRKELRSTFLDELDGMEEDYRGVLTVATTNHPEELDPALLHRPSRFDYRFEFPLPDDAQRRAFVLHWVEKLAALGHLSGDEPDIHEIVRRSQGMSQAYLKRVLVGTVMRMQNQEERGEVAFRRIALEELSDAVKDRTIAHRAEGAKTSGNGVKVGFHAD